MELTKTLGLAIYQRQHAPLFLEGYTVSCCLVRLRILSHRLVSSWPTQLEESVGIILTVPLSRPL